MKIETAYARAFYQMISESNQSTVLFPKVYAELMSLNEALSSYPEAISFLTNPVLSLDEKTQLLSAVFSKLSFDPISQSFIRVLVENGRIGFFQGVLTEMRRMRVEAGGGTLGELSAAFPLSPDMVSEIASIFKKRLGKDVEFVVAHDPTLLAGFKARIDGVTYDASMSGELNMLKEILTQNQARRSYAN